MIETLSAQPLHKMDAYWRAANYLSVGQIYLYDNPLLKRPLMLVDVKHMLLGHWGTTPGQNFICVHLNRVIKKYDLDMIYVSGPGHGGPAVVGNTYLEDTYSEIYPDISQDETGLLWYLARTEKMSTKQFNEMVNFQSGLLGISETSSDMRDLLDRETHDVRAAEAVALFCYQIKKWIGAFVAALGGLDTLVFAGGIGENAPVVRARISDGLEFLGIQLEEKQNVANAGMISAAASRVAVRVIHTDEEWMIANMVCRVLALTIKKEHDHENKRGV